MFLMRFGCMAMRSFVNMPRAMGIMLGKDYWHIGTSLGGLGLSGMAAAEIRDLLVNGFPGSASSTGVTRKEQR